MCLDSSALNGSDHSYLPFFHHHSFSWYITSIFVFSSKALLLLLCLDIQAPSGVQTLFPKCSSRHWLPLTWIPYMLWHDLSRCMSTYIIWITLKLAQEFFEYFPLLNLWATRMNSEVTSPQFPLCSWMQNGIQKSQLNTVSLTWH